MTEKAEKNTLAAEWTIIEYTRMLLCKAEYLSDIDYLAEDNNEDARIAHALACLAWQHFAVVHDLSHATLAAFAAKLRFGNAVGLKSVVQLYQASTALTESVERMRA